MGMQPNIGQLVSSVLALLVVISVPAAGAIAGPDLAQVGETDESVDVGVGARLSTVIAATEIDVQAAVDRSTFARQAASANDTDIARSIQSRATTLSEQRDQLQSELASLQTAVTAGNITQATFVREVALVHAETMALTQAYQQLNQSVERVPAQARQANGIEQATIIAEAVSGAELNSRARAAVFNQLTGEDDGEIRVRTTDGVEIEVEHDDGEISREWERPDDGDRSFTLDAAAAADRASTVLPQLDQGEWVTEGPTERTDDGAYELTYRLAGGATADAEVEITIDGSSGEVIEYESEIEGRDADHDGDDDQDELDDDDRDDRDGDDRDDRDDDDRDDRDDDDRDDRDDDDRDDRDDDDRDDRDDDDRDDRDDDDD